MISRFLTAKRATEQEVFAKHQRRALRDLREKHRRLREAKRVRKEAKRLAEQNAEAKAKAKAAPAAKVAPAPVAATANAPVAATITAPYRGTPATAPWSRSWSPTPGAPEGLRGGPLPLCEVRPLAEAARMKA